MEGETLPSWAEPGLCSGYTIMMMRADMVGEKEIFLKRLSNLADADDNKLIEMGKLLYLYKKRFADEVNLQLATLQKKLEECKADEEKKARTLVEHKKNSDFKNIERYAISKLTTNEIELLNQAQDIYAFISSLLYAQNPSRVGLQAASKKVQQYNYIAISDVITPEKIMNSNIIITNPFSLAFVFTRQELVSLVNNVIKDQDYIYIASATHAMYITRKGREYFLYDSNNKNNELDKFNNSTDLVAAIEKYLFGNMYQYRPTEYMPIEIHIFEKRNKDEKAVPRVNSMKLIQDILSKRETQDPINVKSLEGGLTALFMAVKKEHTELVSYLLKSGSNIDHQDDRGETVLLYAIIKENIDIIEVLLARLWPITQPAKADPSKIPTPSV